jgi:hypothetical protein
MTTLCAWPVRTVLFRPICAYCGKKESFYANCDYKLAVLACDDSEHRRMAERDAKSWLHKNGRVRPDMYRQEPLFHETHILITDVKVPRSSGEVDAEGWRIARPSFDNPAFIQFNNAKWHIPVINEEKDIRKCIRIEDLKLSLPVHKHALVDDLQAKLVQGFYLAESIAYDEAKKLEEEQDNPTPSSTKAVPEECIQSFFHPVYGIGRKFVPPGQEPAEAQGDPAQAQENLST